MRFRNNSRRYGYHFAYQTKKFIEQGLLFLILENAKTKKTPAQKYIADLVNWEKAVAKRHPNVWGDLVNDKNRLTPEKIKKMLEYENINEHFDAWDKAKECGLSRINAYKTTTLSAWHCPDYDIEGIQRAMDEKGQYSCKWRYKYDCSVEVNATEEVKRAWFSLEYKGMLNGHYYYLLNPNLAIFGEDD
jgi:hypothetical protein